MSELTKDNGMLFADRITPKEFADTILDPWKADPENQKQFIAISHTDNSISVYYAITK